MPLIRENLEVASRLDEFGVTKQELMQVVRAAVAARRDATLDDPLTASGQLAYIHGTRALRRIFVPKGYERCRTDNIESVYHAGSGVKIIYQNADSAADPTRDPGALSGKGPAAARAVDMGQGWLFPEIGERVMAEANAASWYLFVYIDGDDVRAELSFPKAVEGGQFSGFNERIFLLEMSEWEKIDLSDNEPADQEFEITVTRKLN